MHREGVNHYFPTYPLEFDPEVSAELNKLTEEKQEEPVIRNAKGKKQQHL